MTAKLYNFGLERARRHATAKLLANGAAVALDYKAAPGQTVQPDSHYGWDCLTKYDESTEFTEAELSELQQALGSEVKP